MATDRHRERDDWLLLLGGALGGPAAKKEALEGIADDEPPDADLRALLKALREYDGKDGTNVQQSLEGFGVRVNGKLLASVKERCRSLARERRISEQVARVNAARINESLLKQEVEKLRKVLE